jgi:hypothetical protein
MHKLKFFDPHTGNLVREFTDSVFGLDFTPGLHGSLEGNASIKVEADSESFLKSLKENSHFVKIFRDHQVPYGAIVEAATINHGVCSLKVIGWDQLTDKIEMTAFHKANAIGEKTIVKKEDPSWSVNWASDSAVGVYYLQMKELRNTMIARGERPFFELGNIRDFIESSTAETFAREYRFNSLEFPTVKSVSAKIFEDSEMETIVVTVDDSDVFIWKLDVLTYYRTVELSSSLVRDIKFEETSDVSRSYSLATGTDLSGDTVLSKITYDPTVAYSSFIASNPADKTTAIDRINRSAMADADKRKEQVSFTVFDTLIGIQDVVELSGPKMPLTKIVITQISINDRNVTYTGTVVTDASVIVKGIRKPTDEVKRMIYKPLDYASDTAKEVAFKQPNSTGWRS